MLQIISIILSLEIKDWLILITLTILIFCISEIRRLKKVIVNETQKRLIPQLAIEYDPKNICLFIKNEGILLAKDIKVDDLAVMLEDFGFEMGFVLKFNSVEFLRTNEKVKLDFKVFRRDEEVKVDMGGKVVLNLMTTQFKLKIYFSNIENIRFRVVFACRKDKFYVENVEPV